MVLFTLFFAFGVAQPTGRHSVAPKIATMKNSSARPATTWAFEGCWQQFTVNPCRDVYRDEQGNYWICRDCGTTGKPGPGKCSQTSSAALARGFWCS
jgi:hypothetical protein